MRKRKNISQDKINKVILDILEDIIGNPAVFSGVLAQKVTRLNCLVIYGLEPEEL